MRAFIVLISLIVVATSNSYNGQRGGGSAPHVASYNGARGRSAVKARSVASYGAHGRSAVKARSVAGYNGARGRSAVKARSVASYGAHGRSAVKVASVHKARSAGGYNGGRRGASVAQKGLSVARKAVSQAIKGRSRKVGGYNVGGAPKAKSVSKKAKSRSRKVGGYNAGGAPKAKSASKKVAPAPKPAVNYQPGGAATTAATTAATSAATIAATTTAATAPIVTTKPILADIPLQLQPIGAPKYAVPCTTRTLEEYQEELLCLSRYVEKLAYAVAAHQEVEAKITLDSALNAKQEAVINDVNPANAGKASERVEPSGEGKRRPGGYGGQAASRSSNVGTNPDGSLTGASIGLIVGCILGAALIAVVIIAFSVVRKRKIEMMQNDTPLLMDHQ